jgi:hypothetical protein
MTEWASKSSAELKSKPGRLKPFNDITEERARTDKRRRKEITREGRLGLFGNDPEETGQAILEHAVEYRKTHPDALLSECMDSWLEKRRAEIPTKLHGEDSARFFDEHPATKMNDAFAPTNTGLDTNGDAVIEGKVLREEEAEATRIGNQMRDGR